MALIKITVLGSGGVGKTAFTIQLCSNHFVEEYDATIENNYRRQVVVDGEACVLDILDTAGQEDYSALRAQWIQSGQGYLIMYSIDEYRSFEGVETFHKLIIDTRDQDVPPPIIIVGNKCDLEDSRQVTYEEGKQLAANLQCLWYEGSAKKLINIEEVFYQLVREIRKCKLPDKDQKRKNVKKENKLKMSLKKLPSRVQDYNNKNCVLF